MMDHTSEQALRREAIRRRLQGERWHDICRDLGRSPAWLGKWWKQYCHNPKIDFADRSRAPHNCPHQTSDAVEQAVIEIRQTLVAGQTQDTQYGFVGHRAIRRELERLEIRPRPSGATIQRILARHGLTQPRGVSADRAFYPGPQAWAPDAIHATDLITKHLRGGQVVQNLHTFDHYSHAAYVSQAADKRSTTIRAHLLGTWADLGIPVVEQLDNESSFRGGHSHPRVIGHIVRLCLLVGVQVLFIPEYEAERNYWVEGFHSLWVGAFWSRKEFGSLPQVQEQAPVFLRWYHTRYQPPSLAGKTPAQMRRGFQAVKLTAQRRRSIPEDLPISQGRINFIRKVDAMGKVHILNESWWVGRPWIGEYVWAVVDTARQTLAFWHRPGAQAAWKHIKTRRYDLKEPIHPVLPEFRRNRLRCRDQWPG